MLNWIGRSIYFPLIFRYPNLAANHLKEGMVKGALPVVPCHIGPPVMGDPRDLLPLSTKGVQNLRPNRYTEKQCKTVLSCGTNKAVHCKNHVPHEA